MQSFLKYSQIFTVCLALAEAVYFTWMQPRGYDWKMFFSSITHKFLQFLFAFFLLRFFWYAMVFAYQHRIFEVSWQGPLGLTALFLAIEFFYYWQHRFSHRIRFFWASHGVHHVAYTLNYASGMINPWIPGSVGALLPVYLLGFPPFVVALAWGGNLAVQIWLHSNWFPRLGVLETMLNTPAHHRVHHARNDEYASGNYGGLLIVFDHLFGTFVPEQNGVTFRYGVRGVASSYNPVRAMFFEWQRMGADLWRASSPRAAVRALWETR